MLSHLLPGGDSFKPGRYGATIDEVKAFFVDDAQFEESTTRAEIWDEWQIATEFLSTIVSISYVWIAGSFTSLKVDPDDIDCLYWIKSDELLNARKQIPEATQILEIFSRSKVRDIYKLRVDSYISAWRAIPEPKYADYLDEEYYSSRGHWDDFWQRKRISLDHLPPTVADAIPRRGYLEVKFNGFE